MRRHLVVLVLSVMAAASGLAVVSAPALAAGPAGSLRHVESGPPVASGKLSTVAPLSQGYVVLTQPNGSSALTRGSSQPMTLVSANDFGFEFTFTPSEHLYVYLALSSGQIPSAGTTYSSGAGVSVDIESSLGSCHAIASVQVDQFAPAGSSSPSTYAIQFSCADPSGQNWRGAIAYNAVPTTPHQGYYLFKSTGALYGFGNDNYLRYLGDLSATPLNAPIVGMAITPDGGGYWMVASDGGIFAFGDATFDGSTGGMHLNKPIVGMATTADGGGYWLVASDGGIFAFGDAVFSGSTGGIVLNKPVVGMAAAPGGGYWLVASDGGIFSFGGATFYGSTGNLHLNKPVVGMTASPGGGGYWFVATDGGIFSFGAAQFHGSAGSLSLAQPVVGMAATGDGSGYWLVARDGGIFSFGAPFDGSLGGSGLTDVAGIAS